MTFLYLPFSHPFIYSRYLFSLCGCLFSEDIYFRVYPQQVWSGKNSVSRKLSKQYRRLLLLRLSHSQILKQEMFSAVMGIDSMCQRVYIVPCDCFFFLNLCLQFKYKEKKPECHNLCQATASSEYLQMYRIYLNLI